MKLPTRPWHQLSYLNINFYMSIYIASFIVLVVYHISVCKSSDFIVSKANWNTFYD